MATLKVTCKDHEDPVEHRNLHAAARRSYSGLSMLAKSLLTPILESQHHIVKDARQLAQRLSQIQGNMLLRSGLKSFFTSGSALQLGTDVSLLFTHSKPKMRTMTETLLFLLSNQFVISNELSARLWQSIVGTGMGLKHSSEVANSAPHVCCESTFAAYFRYFDDISVAGTSLNLFNNVFRRFKSACDYFRTVLVEQPDIGVDMLHIHVVLRNGRFWRRAIFNPSSLSIPLSPDNAHPHVHT
jgi:hypothetical protein